MDGRQPLDRARGRHDVSACPPCDPDLAPLSGRVKFRSEPGGEWTDYLGALTDPHHAHQFDGCGESVAQIFAEPETQLGRALLERCNATRISSLPDAECQPWIEALHADFTAGVSDEQLVGAAQRALAALSRFAPTAPSIDPRIAKAIAHMRARMSGPVSLGEVAEVAQSSPSRFRHLFAEQTGMAFAWTRYGPALEPPSRRRWRASRGPRPLKTRASPTRPISTRTCRRMFGLAPTMLVRQ